MLKEKLKAWYDAINKNVITQFGFKIEDVTFSKFEDYLHAPKDASSLAVTRILFGLAMLFDISDERGGAAMDKLWGDPKTCHFPLFPFIQAMPMPYMAAVYAGLWFGAIGIMLGYKYRYSAPVFTICYWYLFLVEKSYWNNHSYLFGLVALLFTFTEANCYWSIDAYLDPSKSKAEVPYWNYFILKYQFFILYFMAGMKKGTAEWLTGYSVQNLSEHWVFEPFKLLMTVPQIDYLIVHWFVFVFDLTVSVWMMCSSTRNVAMVFCAMFHLMNSRLFMIGMFPWVCLATMPLFYPFDWPKKLPARLLKIKFFVCKLLSKLVHREQDKTKSEVAKAGTKLIDVDTDLSGQINDEQARINSEEDDITKGISDDDRNDNGTAITAYKNCDGRRYSKSKSTGYNRKKITVYLIIFHVLTQAFLPYSHFITQGYNNWTNGLYGYSWDMMVHTWATHSVIVLVRDNEKQNEFYLNHDMYSPNQRWTMHGDMVHQYARCLEKKLMEDAERYKVNNKRVISDNISIFVDVWCSMNGRFTQRIFDPKVDILKAEWSPFEKVSFLMPLLDDASEWRADIERMKRDVHSWTNYSDVVFLADFPGYEQEKYISEDIENVTLTVLKGDVAYQPEVTRFYNGQTVQLTSGDRISVSSGIFHKVLNIGEEPAFYMYTFSNTTELDIDVKENSMLPLLLLTELSNKFLKMFYFCYVMLQSLHQMYFCLSNCH